MPRNRYTRAIREAESNQIAKQEQELTELDLALDPETEGNAEAVLPFAVEDKSRRSRRLDQRRRHKPERFQTGNN